MMFTRIFIITLLCSLFFYFKSVPKAYAVELPPCPCISGSTCKDSDCDAAEDIIEEDHEDGREEIKEFFKDQMEKYQDWLIETFFKDNLLRAMMMMTEQLTAVGYHQVDIIGTFFDIDHQFDKQRKLAELRLEAHKDYHPSRDFCWFGTNIRSLGHSEHKSRLNAEGLNQRQLERQLALKGTANSLGASMDTSTRWDNFIHQYCDPRDNNWIHGDNDEFVDDTGLRLACNNNDPRRVNNDIDYTRMVDFPHTLDVDFSENSVTATETEDDIMALMQNLYSHDPVPWTNAEYAQFQETPEYVMAVRSMISKREVAESSFNAIVGMKSAGSTDSSGVYQYLSALMEELGVPENQVADIIGENPSYYAQLEIIAKKIYQNPDFYAYLYDKPANVERKATALKAIELMLDRAIYESQLRREMATSVLLSLKLRKSAEKVSANRASGG